ncbi:TPA: acyltransferase, partial [Streptococcus suis]|nr:acyltransferase [Streptococcus suis]
VSIGNRVRIYPGARMETHNGGEIIIGDNCSIGQNFHIISDENRLIIGKNTTISSNVFITNTEHDYKEIGEHILKQRMLTSETQIGENCFIGFGASIQAGTVLGKQCIVGTNAVVRGTYPDYSVIVGVPAKAIKRYNEETGDWEKI